jgi:hypothetical protein
MNIGSTDIFILMIIGFFRFAIPVILIAVAVLFYLRLKRIEERLRQLEDKFREKTPK